jgi:large subunit ribosomal protein L4
MELTVYKIDGSATAKTVTLNDKIFNVEPNDHAIWLDVKQYLANQRQGTHNTLERSTVSGSTRKLKRQKGTGGARAGSIKSPTIRGGATVFGPHPRDYGFKLNKKVKRLARFSAFTYKQQEGCITIVEDFTFNAPKTKDYKAMLESLNLEGKKTLLLLPDTDRNVYLSGRNLQRTNIMRAIEANTYHVLNANNLIICESSLKELEKMLGE